MQAFDPDFAALLPAAELSEPEQELIAHAREVLGGQITPHINDVWLRGDAPRAWLLRLGEAGLLGVTTPVQYGGRGLGARAYGMLMHEIEACDSGVRSSVSVQGALVQYPIRMFGSEAQRQHWLPGLANGQLVGSFALTEPLSGSDPGSMQCRARREGSTVVLNGTKRWVTNGPWADVFVVWARDEQDGKVRGYLVPRATAGLHVVTMDNKYSLRASVTAEIVMADCRVDAEAQLPGAVGLGAPLKCLMEARYGIAWGVIGAASQCYHAARQYALDRTQFGRALAGFQLVQQKLADMLSDITHMQLLVVQLARLKDAGTLTTQQVSLAKRDNVRRALAIARTARDIMGANGILGEYPVMRHMANLETVNTYEGTHDVHTLVLGQTITGLDAFRG